MNCLPEVACEPVWVDDSNAHKSVTNSCQERCKGLQNISHLSSKMKTIGTISEEHRQQNFYLPWFCTYEKMELSSKSASHVYGLGTIKYAVNDLLLSVVQHDGWLLF